MADPAQPDRIFRWLLEESFDSKGNVISYVFKAEDVAGIGLDCTACTVLPCRTDGTPLGRALLWMDQRAFRGAICLAG